MMRTVLAAVATSPETTELREFSVPELSAESALLKVEMLGVCGTDVANYKAIEEPTILGHHVVGYIEAIGPVASQRWGLREGDRVVMEEYIPCGHCSYCRSGLYRLCRTTDPHQGGLRYGATPVRIVPSLWGGFSQSMYLHPDAVPHKISSTVPAAEAAMSLPLANGFEWMYEVGRVGPGKTVVIQGPGQQGLVCVIAAKFVGAECIIVTGRTTSLKRLDLARQLGADVVVNVQEENLYDCVHQALKTAGGQGAPSPLLVTVSPGVES